MKHLPRLLSAGSALLLCVCSSSLARSVSPRFQLDYSAAPDCASENELRAALEEQLPRTSSLENSAETSVPRVKVRLIPNASHVEARVAIDFPSSRVWRRTLSAGTCREAIVAAAFVIAVALDPSRAPGSGEPKSDDHTDDPSRSAPGTTSAETSPSENTTKSASSSSVDQESTPRQSQGKESPRLRPERARPLDSSKRRSPGRSPRSSEAKSTSGATTFAGLHFTTDSGASPHLLFGAAFGLGWALREPGLWSPTVLLEAGYGWSGDAVTPSGVAHFELGQLTLRLCPSTARLGPVDVRLCASTRGGWLNVAGSEVDEPAQVIRPWLDLGPSLLITIPTEQQFRFQMNFGATFPLIRDEFLFDNQVFHQTPPVALGATLGVLVDFF